MMLALVADPAVALVVRAGLVLLFASAAAHKLRDRAAFAGVLAAYRLLPEAVVPAATIVVALGELAVAAGLALGSVVVGPLGALGLLAVYSAIALLAIYALAIGVNLARGRRTIDCGCGALGARQPIGEWLLARNAFLAVAAASLLRPVAGRVLSWIDVLSIAGAVVVAASVWTAAHALAAAAERVRAVGVRS
jgi:hypothetical protein